MKRFGNRLNAAIITATLLTAGSPLGLVNAPAFAQGGGGDIEEQREQLKEDLRKSRDAKENNISGSLFDRFFGSDNPKATAEKETKETKKQ